MSFPIFKKKAGSQIRRAEAELIIVKASAKGTDIAFLKMLAQKSQSVQHFFIFTDKALFFACKHFCIYRDKQLPLGCQGSYPKCMVAFAVFAVLPSRTEAIPSISVAQLLVTTLYRF